MTDGESKSNSHHPPADPSSARWQWYLVVVLVVGSVEPLVGSVRQATQPHVGRWPAYALGLLAAAVAAAPIFAVVTWVLRRERSADADGLAAMVYRPAALPAVAFVGAVFQDFPSALTEWATWGFLGGVVVLLAGAVLVQRRRSRAWSWWAAVPAGFGIALVALLVAAVVSQLAPGAGRPA